MSAVVELIGVGKTYPGDPPTRVLDDVDLRIERGELVAIVGPSGSGKSTMLNIIGTLDRQTEGTVVVAGHDTSSLSDSELSGLRSQSIGFVFQQFFLLGGMAAIDNVADGLLYSGRPLTERRELAHAAMVHVGLAHRLQHDPSKLSGGERQRVAIARALVGEPSIVLADEPTGNLDSRSSAAIIELLHELHRSGSSILVITHDRDIAAGLPRQVEVRDGRIERDSGGPRAVAASTDGHRPFAWMRGQAT